MEAVGFSRADNLVNLQTARLPGMCWCDEEQRREGVKHERDLHVEKCRGNAQQIGNHADENLIQPPFLILAIFLTR